MKKLLLLILLIFNACKSEAQIDTLENWKDKKFLQGTTTGETRITWSTPPPHTATAPGILYGDAGIIEDTAHFCDCFIHLEKYREKLEADEFLMQALLEEVYRLRKHTKRRHRYPPQ